MRTKTDNVKRLHWMPTYVADCMAETMHLSAIQFGAYRSLVYHYWLRGGLPTDDAQLARIARMTDEEWRDHKHVIREFFAVDWKSASLDRELATCEDLHRKRAAAGRKGRRAQLAGNKTKNSDFKRRANAGQTPGILQPQPQPQLQTSSEESPYQEDTKPQRGTPTSDTASLPANVHRLPKTGGAA